MTGQLEGRCAVVTGGGRGIGRAVCRAFAREGAKLVIAGHTGDPVDEAVSEIKRQGGAAVGYRGDCADEDAAEACVDTAVQRFGRLDVLVLSGSAREYPADTQDMTIEAFERLMRDDLQSSFLLTRCALDQLRAFEGVILATASESRLTGLGGHTAFGGARAFMHAFINGLAVEQAQYGVRANCICPAWTQSTFNDGAATTIESKDVTLEQVAELFVLLAGDEARSVTGEILYADDERPTLPRPAQAAERRLESGDAVRRAYEPARQHAPAIRRPERRRRAAPSVGGRTQRNGNDRPARPVVQTRPMDAFSCITQQLLLDD